MLLLLLLFFFNDTATTEIYTLSLHDALPIYRARRRHRRPAGAPRRPDPGDRGRGLQHPAYRGPVLDRKSTRLNSSHSQISYAVFCLKKKKNKKTSSQTRVTNCVGAAAATGAG